MNSKQKCSKKLEKKTRIILSLVVILISVIIDLVTKTITDKSGKSYKLISDYLAIQPIKNSGMAFGMLGEWKYAQPMFITITVIIFIAVGAYCFLTNNNSVLLHLSIAFIMGGTLGNFIDRVLYREVRDFIALDLRMPIFQFNCNVADIFITIGAVMLFVYLLFVDNNALFKNKKNEDNK